MPRDSHPSEFMEQVRRVVIGVATIKPKITLVELGSSSIEMDIGHRLTIRCTELDFMEESSGKCPCLKEKRKTSWNLPQSIFETV